MDELFFERIRIDVGSKWERFPSWAALHFAVGGHLGRTSTAAGRIVVAVAVPIRAFAAVLSATAVVLARASGEEAGDDPEKHFERLSALGLGTPVNLERNSKQYRGVLSRIDTMLGEQYLRIQLQDQEAGGEAHYVPARDSLRITPAHGIATPLPLQARGMASVTRRNFVRSLIKADRIRGFGRETRLECVLVGRQSILREEIIGTPLVAQTDATSSTAGKFNDLLRVRQLLFPGRSYKTELLSSSAKRVGVQEDLVPHVALFDGAPAFIKWHHLWPESHVLVLLDKTEPRYTEAVTILNQDFTSPKNHQYKSMSILDTRGAVDVFAYQGQER